MRMLLFALGILISNANAQDNSKVDRLFLKSVVQIKKPNLSSGTGFLIGLTLTQPRRIFLVTNKHMIGDWSMVDPFIPERQINVTLYSNNSSVNFFDIKVPISDLSGKLSKNVLIHPDPSVDVAVIYLSDSLLGIGKTRLNILDTSFLSPIDSIETTTFIGLGSQVFAIGYPANIKITRSNEPIVKSGYLASTFSGDLDIESTWQTRSKKQILVANRSKYFLVDGIIIGGNSGSPIFSPKVTFLYENGHLFWQETPIQNRIIGIVSYIQPNTGICTVYAARLYFGINKGFGQKDKTSLK